LDRADETNTINNKYAFKTDISFYEILKLHPIFLPLVVGIKSSEHISPSTKLQISF